MIFIRKQNNEVELCEPEEYTHKAYSKDEEEFIKIISINEYNGYLNALRIINERMMKQIDKNKRNESDVHGYKIISCEKKPVENRSEKKCWYITKRTPVTIEIDINSAILLIESQLKLYYNYVSSEEGEEILNMYDSVKSKNTDQNEILLMRKGIDYTNMIKNMEEYEIISFGLFRIVKNYMEGVYDITYKATQII